MVNPRVRSVQTSPTGDSGTQSEFSVVGVGKIILVESTDLIQHLTAIHCRASVRPENLFNPVELAVVELSRTSAAVLAVKEDQMSGFIYSTGIAVDQDFGGGHADVRAIFEDACE